MLSLIKFFGWMDRLKECSIFLPESQPANFGGHPPTFGIDAERSEGLSFLQLFQLLWKRPRHSIIVFFDNFIDRKTRLVYARSKAGCGLMISGNHRDRCDSPSRSRRYPGVCPTLPLLPILPAFQFSF